MLQKLSEGEGMKFDSTRVARPVTAKVDSSLDLKVDSRIWPEVWSIISILLQPSSCCAQSVTNMT